MDAAPPTPPLSVIITAFQHAIATKYYNTATLAIVIYDHVLTFDTEVEKVWKQKWSLPKVLWFIFRYLTPLIQIGSVLADQLTIWTPGSCFRWLWVGDVGNEIVTAATSIVLILRVWSLFHRSYTVLSVMLAALITQTVVTLWSWLAFEVAVLPPGFVGCYPMPKSVEQLDQVASLFVTLLVFDTVIFLFTVLRILEIYFQRSHSSPIISTMLRDGVAYFAIICLVNLANVLLIQIPSVPTDLKPLNTEFTPNITVILVSRLFLNLRTASQTSIFIPAPAYSTSATSTLVGNLGEPVELRSDLKVLVATESSTYAGESTRGEIEMVYIKRKRESVL